MTKHQRWAMNARKNNKTKETSDWSNTNPGVIQGILTHNHTPKLPSMQAWRRATTKEQRKPGKVAVVKG